MSTAATTHLQDEQETVLTGFWIYIMTDCVLFASLFATYAVLHNNIVAGPSSREIIDLSPVLIETLILLTSSFTCGLALLALQRKDKKQILGWLMVTILLGLTFLGLEFNEFHHLITEGHSYTTSAFLSAFFTLIGTHGLHIAVGSFWATLLIIELLVRGLHPATIKRLLCFSLFWHFLDIIWIFIFTIVYLMGAR